MIDQDQTYSTIKHEYGATEPHTYFEKFLSTSITNLPGKPLASQGQIKNFRAVLIKIKKPELPDEHPLINDLVFIFLRNHKKIEDGL